MPLIEDCLRNRRRKKEIIKDSQIGEYERISYIINNYHIVDLYDINNKDKPKNLENY